MRKVKTLIVSNHPGTRQSVLEIFREIPDIETLGFAATGRDAVKKMHAAPPQLVFLDLTSAGDDILKTLLQIRNACPGVPVIPLSSEETHNPALILQTLSVGAVDYIVIPHDFLTDADQRRRLYLEIQKKLNIFFKRGQSQPTAATAAPAQPMRPAASGIPASRPSPARAADEAGLTTPVHEVRVVAVGVSTGGPNTLARLLNEIPEHFPVPILIVQHMPAGFTAPLARRLSAQVAIRVVEAANGLALEPGKAYIAPGNHHMEVGERAGKVSLQITQGPPENSCRPSVDVLFRSVARVFGPGVLAAVLTGMGQDGLRGAESITQAGGKVLAQDEATSVVWGMPGAVVQAGLADQVMPIDRLAREIVNRAPSPNPLKAALLEEMSAHQSGRV